MRRFLVYAMMAFLAACGGLPQKPQNNGTSAVKPKPQRFDGLAMLAEQRPPERNRIRERYRYDRSIRATDIDGLRYFFYEPDRQRSVVGFAIQNTGSPKINPRGLQTRGAHREYAFMFADRAAENIHLAINDDVKLSGRFSHDNMFRELHFFPRRQLPAMTIDHARGLVRVTLPTGEPVLFDQDTMELAGGALIESPIDFNRSRHQRHNPEVRYQGDFLAITVAQRGEDPRRAKVWGQNKVAEVYYPSRYRKACRISPKYLWDQRPKAGDTDPKLTMLHRSDREIFNLIERRCGWDLSALKKDLPRLAEASDQP